jgi:cytochrome P450
MYIYYYFLVLVSDYTNVENGTIICFRYLPNKNNRQIWRLEKEINSNISKLVKQRQEEGREQDLLQMILEGATNCEGSDGLLSSSISRDRFIIDNCKTIFFAGHDTTSITASWCLMLLATYQDWQDRARAEVLEVCGNSNPDASMLRSMKTVCFILKLHVSVKYIKSIAHSD